jgi:PAS domain S-box-containing protein
MMKRPLAIWLALVVAAYVAAGRLGLSLEAVSGFATILWAPSGVAVGALFVLGYRVWPGIAVGAFLVNLWVGASVPVALGIAAGNTLEAIVAVYCLRRVGFHAELDRVRDVVALAGLAAVLSSMIAASIGTTSAWLGGHVESSDLAITWLAWWSGDLGGILLVAPALLVWSTEAPPSAIVRPTRNEALLLAASFVLAAPLVFAGLLPRVLAVHYLMLPLLVWAALRFGPRGAATASLAVGVMAMASTVMGLSPFAGATVQDQLARALPYAVTSMLISLGLGAFAVSRAREAIAVRRSKMHLAAIIDATLDAVVTIDHAGIVRAFNPSAEEMFGYAPADAIGKELAALVLAPSVGDTRRAELAHYVHPADVPAPATRVRFLARRANGTEFPAEIAIVRLQTDGVPTFTAFIRDVTAIEALERSHDELERAVEHRTADLRQTNLDLRRREEQLRETQELAGLGSFEWDIAADGVTWSDQLYRIYGVAPGTTLTAEDFFRMIHPDDRERARAIIARALVDHQPFSFEERIVRGDGEVRALRSQVKVEVASGRAIRLRGACLDITEQRRAEQARARLAAIVESSADAIVGEARDGRIETWNVGAEKMYGHTASEAVGQPMSLVVPESQWETHLRMVERVWSGERVVGYETIRRRRDGTLFEASITKSPILDDSGHTIGIATIARDITAQKRAFAKFRKLVEAAPDAIVIVDRAGKIVLANSQTAKLFGYRESELVGAMVETIVPERLRDRHRDHRAGYLRDPKPRPMGSGLELFGLRKDGTEFPIEISLAPIETEEELLVSAAVRDITERKLVESRLLQSLQDKEVLLREIHHRVKNNLQVIASLLDLQAAITYPEARAAFAEGRQRVYSMALVHELLYQSRDLASIELDEYLRRLVTTVAKSYRPAGNIQLITRAPGVQLDIDTAVPCGLIVNELVSNALKHAFPGGRSGHIEVSLERDADDRFVLTVSDDGVGMPPEVELESTRTLGLRIVAALTHQLHGDIVIVRDHGTRFRIAFPVPSRVKARRAA